MHRGRIYWPDCKVCQYMKKNIEFRRQVMESSYFEPLGKESLGEVVHRWGDPFKMPSVYSHMRRHQSKPTREIEVSAPVTAVPLAAIESEVLSETAHERGLDEVIAKGRQMVRTGEIKVTGATLLTAIKTKAEIERSTKDRRVDVMKMMAGAFGGTDTGGEKDEG